MTQSRRSSRPKLARLAAAVVLGVGCGGSVPVDEPCYPALSEIEGPVGGHTYLGCAEYDGEYVPGDVLPVSDGVPEGVGTEEFVYCFDLEPGQACDGCSLDDTEQVLRDAYVEAKECKLPITDPGECSHYVQGDDGYYEECCTAAECEQIIYAYSRGCAFTDEETGQCCYTAAISSPCTGRQIQ